MTEAIRNKIAKVYELVNRGATDGERAAAKNQLDKLLNKHGIKEDQLDSIDKKEYKFKYTTNLELLLLGIILKYFVPGAFEKSKRAPWRKDVVTALTYLDWVTIESAYEYFRRHMKKEWKRLCMPELKKCRKSKTRNKRREQLQDVFLTEYVIKSKLYDPNDLVNVELNGKEMEDRMKVKGVEGGEYHKQVITTHLLTN